MSKPVSIIKGPDANQHYLNQKITKPSILVNKMTQGYEKEYKFEFRLFFPVNHKNE